MAGLLTTDSTTTSPKQINNRDVDAVKTDQDNSLPPAPSSLDDVNKSRTVSPSSSSISSNVSTCSQNEDYDLIDTTLNNNIDDDSISESNKKSKKTKPDASKTLSSESDANGADKNGNSSCKLNRKITLKVSIRAVFILYWSE